MIKVLIADDSPVVREYLHSLLTPEHGFEVVGTARDGIEAVTLAASHAPDVITMDVAMPRMNGLDATRSIMESCPVPIIIVSANYHPEDVEKTFHALEAGAVAVVARPSGPGHSAHEQTAHEFQTTVKLMSEIRVVKRWASLRNRRPAAPPAACVDQASAAPDLQIIAVGASTGGPPTLLALVAGLPKELKVPVLIVQHIAAGFVRGFTEWLAQASSRKIYVAGHDEFAVPGRVYVAPDAMHMGISKDGYICLSPRHSGDALCPSVDHLFRSVGRIYGRRSAGVLLTGMGRDGAEGLHSMRLAGAVTIAQNAESSVVHGMPGEAIRLGAAGHVLAPDQIAVFLSSLLRKEHPFKDRVRIGS